MARIASEMILGYPERGVRYQGPFVDFSATATATANDASGVEVRQPATCPAQSGRR